LLGVALLGGAPEPHDGDPVLLEQLAGVVPEPGVQRLHLARRRVVDAQLEDSVLHLLPLVRLLLPGATPRDAKQQQPHHQRTQRLAHPPPPSSASSVGTSPPNSSWYA